MLTTTGLGAAAVPLLSPKDWAPEIVCTPLPLGVTTMPIVQLAVLLDRVASTPVTIEVLLYVRFWHVVVEASCVYVQPAGSVNTKGGLPTASDVAPGVPSEIVTVKAVLPPEVRLADATVWVTHGACGHVSGTLYAAVDAGGVTVMGVVPETV